MERYQIIFAYDGTQYVGSQRQAGSRTVQSVLEGALRKLGWTGKSILMAGRTDTGVHASGQVATADLDWRHNEEDLRNALNSNLPADLAVRLVRKVEVDFHPRFDAVSRHYQYRIYLQPLRDPLRDRFAWRVWPKPNAELLQEAASCLKGTYDFAAFGSPPRKEGSTIRTVTLSKWTLHQDEWLYDVEAEAFLYRMVRRMVFGQVSVGLGRLDISSFDEAVTEQKPFIAGLALPAGLTLVEVKY